MDASLKNISPWEMESDAFQRRRIELVADSLDGNTFRHGLEFGCDTGYFTQFLSPLCRDVISVDINEKAVDYARQSKHLENVDWQVADLTKYSIVENYFDLISFLECLYYFESEVRRTVLDRAFNGLTQGGTLLISVPLKQAKHKWTYDESFYFESKHEVLDFLRVSGFEIVEHRTVLPTYGGLLKSDIKAIYEFGLKLVDRFSLNYTRNFYVRARRP